MMMMTVTVEAWSTFNLCNGIVMKLLYTKLLNCFSGPLPVTDSKTCEDPNVCIPETHVINNNFFLDGFYNLGNYFCHGSSKFNCSYQLSTTKGLWICAMSSHVLWIFLFLSKKNRHLIHYHRIGGEVRQIFSKNLKSKLLIYSICLSMRWHYNLWPTLPWGKNSCK